MDRVGPLCLWTSPPKDGLEYSNPKKEKEEGWSRVGALNGPIYSKDPAQKRVPLDYIWVAFQVPIEAGMTRLGQLFWFVGLDKKAWAEF